MIVIGISGKALSGKSFLVNQLMDELKKLSIEAAKFSIAEPLKQGIEIMIGALPDKYKYRSLYQDVADTVKNHIAEEWFAYLALKRLEVFETLNPDVDVCIIDDIRFPYEIEMLNPDILVRLNVSKEIRLERLKSIDPSLELIGEEHVSETALDDYDKWDIVINVSSKKDEKNIESYVEDIVKIVERLV